METKQCYLIDWTVEVRPFGRTQWHVHNSVQSSPTTHSFPGGRAGLIGCQVNDCGQVYKSQFLCPEKKKNSASHRVVGRTNGAMHEELVVQHLTHCKSFPPSVCFYLLVLSLLMMVLSIFLGSTLMCREKPATATVSKYSSQMSLGMGCI